MIVNANFRFLVNISLEGYKCKTDATACLSRAGSKAIGMNKMAFKEQEVTPAEFLVYATSGHTFCNIFKVDSETTGTIVTDKGEFDCYAIYRKGANKGAMKVNFKADKYFKGSYTVFVDIDYTSYKDIGEYIDSLILKPTIVYPSYSDNKAKHGVVSRRFRLVYVFSSLLTPERFSDIADAVHEHVQRCTKEPMDDYCGVKPSQYMNGVYGNSETYCTNIIYDGDEFPKENSEFPHAVEDTTEITFDDYLLVDMDAMSYEEFMHKYSIRYRYQYRTEKDEWQYSMKCGARYQLTDENYLQLWMYRDILMDGEHRRRKLFKNACLRRIMFPNMTASELLFNLYVDQHRFFDNSDGVITVDTLQSKVINSFKMSIDELKEYCKFEIEYWKKDRPKYIVHHENKGDIRRIVNIIGGELRYNELDAIYDPTVSVSVNYANGMGVSLRTLYRYCDERCYDTTPRDTPTRSEYREAQRNEREKNVEIFVRFYNPNLSLNKNQLTLRNNGLVLARSTISEWAKKYIPSVESQSFFGVPEYCYTPQIEKTMFTPPSYYGEDDNAFRPNWNIPMLPPSFLNGTL